MQGISVEAIIHNLHHQPPTSYQFTKLRTLDLQILAQQQLPEILIKQYLNDYESQFHEILFQFKVTDNYFSWNIIKRLSNFLSLQAKIKSKYNLRMSIPLRTLTELQQANKSSVLDYLEVYLNHVGGVKQIQEDFYFKKFIERNLPPEKAKLKVYKQVKMSKKGGGRYTSNSLINSLKSWSEKQFTIFSEGLYYSEIDSYEIGGYANFSQNFMVLYGIKGTGHQFQIHIRSDQRVMKIEPTGPNLVFKFVLFVYFLSKAMKQSNSYGEKRFKSFAAVRQKCDGRYYIDGQNYFKDVHDCMMAARKEVLITGWILSPYFCLKRPDKQESSRLDRLLKSLGQRGVSVKIILYWQPKIALNNSSEQVAYYLQSLNENIKVLRHPDSIFDIVWSHHQKIVIIDQKIGFLGGLDIGYGRMDNNKHLLAHYESQPLWPGADYCNYRISDVFKPMQYKVCSIDRKQHPRMPWHDIAIQIRGRSVLDLCQHFIQYWNFANLQQNAKIRKVLAYEGSIVLDRYKSENAKSNSKSKSKSNSKSKQKQHSKSQSSNSDFEFTEQQEQFFKTNFIEKGSHVSMKDLMRKMGSYKSRNGLSIDLIMEQSNIQEINKNFGKQTHQILRSASMWGLGLEEGKEQKSIMNAYVQLIRNSKEFIYIENQFFICEQNPVADEIKARMRKAYANKQNFKIVIIVPSLPGFQGQPQDSSATVLRVQIHLQYDTLCRGLKSIIKQLSYIPNLSDYIQIFNLRTHGVINEKPVTQILYVHSKLMIIDDEIALIGSANINDRSLLGTRDSQIAVVVQDHQKMYIKLEQGTKEVRKFAHNLRVQLYMEHFGLTEEEVKDYMDSKLWNKMKQNSWRNQEIYRKIFGCYPDNKIKNFGDISELKKNAKIQEYGYLIQYVKGHSVQFQEQFLINEDLMLKATDMQSFFSKGFA